jgi:cytochrome c-type biogenesis protein CcmE
MNLKAVVAGIVILGAVALGVFVTSSSGKNFYTVDQFLDLERSPNRAVKIRGLVVGDSLRETGTTIDFEVRDPESAGTRSLPVHFDTLRAQGQRPDTLMPRAEVVIEGHMGEGGIFQANTILAKCPSKYEGEDPAGHTGEAGAAPPAGAGV